MHTVYGFVCYSCTEAVLQSCGLHTTSCHHLAVEIEKFLSSPFPQEGQRSSGCTSVPGMRRCQPGMLSGMRLEGPQAPAPAIPRVLQLAGNILHEQSTPGAHSHLTLATSWGLGTLRRSQRQLRLSLTTGSSASLPHQRLGPVNSGTSTQFPSVPPASHLLSCTFQMAGVCVVSHLRINGYFCTTPSQINPKYTPDLPQETSG